MRRNSKPREPKAGTQKKKKLSQPKVDLNVISFSELLWKLPFFEDVFFSMQGQNIMFVDFYLRDLEHDLLVELVRIERTPMPATLFVSALSQTWVFAAYELLRTWRQRARDLKREAQQPAAAAPRGSPLDEMADEIWQDQVARVRNDPAYVQQVDEASNRIEHVFRRIEALRMNLAKHEVPKKPQRAVAPGYGRISYDNGSITWQVDLGDNAVDIVSRRDLADGLRAVVIGRETRE
jgi:hypothetical protein